MFAGGIGEIGYLAGDSSGTLSYQSLNRHLAPEDRDFTDVWTTHSTRDGIVFQSAERLFRWDGRRMEVWRTPTRFRMSFLVRGVVYVWEDGVGIKALRSRGLDLIPGGGAFADRKVEALLPDGRGLVAIVRDEGLVSIRPNGTTQLVEGSASEYLTSFRPYTAVAVPDRYSRQGILYAVGTVGGGVALVSPSGRLVRVYREDVGLTEGDQVLGLHADRQGGLWVATQNGLVRIDLFARHTWFDEASGLVGVSNSIARHEGVLYVGTTSGLFRQVPGRLGMPGASGPAYTRFESVSATSAASGGVWNVQTTPFGLLVAASDGVYTLKGDRLLQVWKSDVSVFSLVPVGRDRILVGTMTGVVRLALKGGRWVYDGTVDGIEGEARYIQEDATGAVWVSELGGRLYRIGNPGAARPSAESYGAAEGLTVSTGPLNLVGERLLLASRDGVYRIERAGRRIRLTRDPEFGDLTGAYSLYASDVGSAWTYSDGKLGSKAPEFEMAGVQPNDLLVLPSGVSWIATPDGLLRYDPRVSLGDREYPALVRRVTDRQGRVLYGGAYNWPQKGGADLTLNYSAALGLRFEYAAALFDRPSRATFSSRLLGSNDESWSPYAPERVVPYPGLREGFYTFEVQAQDDMGHATTVGQFTVRIRPPWYRTWWAYALYVLAAGGFVWGVTAWRVRKQQQRLEAARARNARMKRLGDRMRETNTRLRRADKLKDDLLANTSHELRTPLTAVLGFSEMLLDEVEEGTRALAQGIQRGGNRLLATVDGLLDMYKLQSGTMELFPQAVDAAAVVRENVRLLAPLAEARGLDLRVLPETLVLPAEFDRGVLDRVLTHVVGNAVKFTEAGSVAVCVDATDHDICVTVRDTGIGIPSDMLERVFEPFEQASTGFARSHEGTGLGLAIVRRLIDLAQGTVTVESTEGEGTAVRIVVPRWANLDGPSRRVATVAENPALAGATLLTLGLGDAAEDLRRAVSPRGEVCAVNTPGQALREAKKLAYDAVFVASADEEGAERKRVALVRGVPGYDLLPVLRVGGEPLPEAELASRGFTHQVALPLDADAVIGILEVVLMSVEAVED